MQLRSFVFLLSLVPQFLASANPARAEALAVAGPHSACLAASVDALRADPGQPLYRIVFRNRCDAPRSFFWCAEHPAATVPSAIACPGVQGGLGADLRYLVRHRKEFQWHLPAGARIRFLDCPAQEIPTADFRCEAPVAATRR